MDYTSIFGELSREVQIRIDEASRLNKQLFDTNIFERYLSWDTPSIGLDVEAIVGKYNLSVAAATLDSRGKEPVMGFEGIELIKEHVLTHQMTLPMRAEDYRKVLQILDSRMLSDDERLNRLIEIMFGNVTSVVNSVQSKLDMIFLGMLSNKGIFTFDKDNNPEAGVRGAYGKAFPTENVKTATADWTAANIDTVDCFADIQSVLDVAQDKSVVDRILLSQSRLSYICRSKKMKMAVFGEDRSSTPLLLNGLNEFMRINNLPVFEVVRRQMRVQNNGTFANVTPWNDKNLVFIPAGQLGTIANAYTDNELRPENGVTYSNYGRIRVSQWGAGETTNSNGVEFTKAQSISIPLITETNGMYSLTVDQTPVA